MASQAPWSPTAHAFAQHQFSHVANFWKQGRPASFRLEALPGGCAELNITFQLPPASEVIPPPFHPVPAQQRPIRPLFPGGLSSQGPASGPKIKPAPQKKVSSRHRKSYRRSELLWLYPPFLLQSVAPYAMLHLPVFSNCKVLQPRQRALKVPTSAPFLTLLLPPLPQTFPR